MQYYTWTQGITLMKKHVEQVNGLDLKCYIVKFWTTLNNIEFGWQKIKSIIFNPTNITDEFF